MNLAGKGIYSLIVQIFTEHLLHQSQCSVHRHSWSMGEKSGVFLWYRREIHAGWPQVLHPSMYCLPTDSRTYFFSDCPCLWATTEPAVSLSPWIPHRPPGVGWSYSSPFTTALGTDLFCFQIVSKFWNSDLQKSHFNLRDLKKKNFFFKRNIGNVAQVCLFHPSIAENSYTSQKAPGLCKE